MSAIASRYGKLLLLPCALLCCLAAAAAAQAADNSSFCVGGHTQTYASDTWPAGDLAYWATVGGYYLDESGEPAEEDGEDYFTEADEGEVFYGVIWGDPVPAGSELVPVTVGACAVDPAGAPARNHSPLCYSKYSDDVAYFDTGDIAGLLSRGYSVPAVTKSGDGYRFVCNWSSTVDANGAELGSASSSGLVATGKKLGSDKATIVSDAFAAGNGGWWEILEPKRA